MKCNLKFFFIAVIITFCFFPLNIMASCNCKSTDPNNPCTGQAITVTVTAGTPNGGTAVDSQYNWSFNSGGGDARCGQFANGDYWVSPAPGESAVTVTAITSNGAVAADANPVTESMGLMDGTKTYGNYNAAENIIPNLPQTFSAPTSILAAVKRNEAVEGACGTAAIVGACIDSYNVVTILSEVPPLAGSDMIRPNITGQSKDYLRFSDLNLGKWPVKSFLTGTTTAGIEAIRQRWSHSTELFGLYNSAGTDQGYCSEGGRAFRAHVLLDDYGAGVAVAWYNDLMTLFSDDNNLQEKKPAIAAMLSYGLDLYHAMYNAPVGATRRWGTGATQHPGKFMPTVLLAALANEKKYAETLKNVSGRIHEHVANGPLELAQVHDGVNGPVWGDVPALSGVNYMGSYWANLMTAQCYDNAPGTCNINVGPKTMIDPHGYIDGPPPKPGTNYISSSLGVQKSMVATMFLLPEVCEIINYDTLVSYVDRVDNHGVQASNDPCVTPDSREDFANCDPYRNTGCLYYGVTWGPINPSDKNSQCITTPTQPYTKIGRFTNVDGAGVGAVYTSSQIERNWAAIRGTSSSCRFFFESSKTINAPQGLRKE